ncbi:hypothetical protein CCM_04579 [Cordyceps militaris CM01]|uniref:Uncharacterized protein n=1 Tax=Cordyceps militaris (strain CM01) TaxID=983644 RepID=G3JFX3_CORMM|nr:uncharacterized protein CCM_04579 [Cordyceps militaris CM01]EGX93207.1 hypothetical protein CCM_04579 [Cordyceps militaris CM01]
MSYLIIFPGLNRPPPAPDPRPAGYLLLTQPGLSQKKLPPKKRTDAAGFLRLGTCKYVHDSSPSAEGLGYSLSSRRIRRRRRPAA